MKRAHTRAASARAKQYPVLLVLIAVCVVLSILAPRFLTGTNISNVLEQSSMIGIIAMGMTMLLVSANFDLSVGGAVALIGVVSAVTINAAGTAVGIVVALLLGLLLGSLNGVLVTRLKINSLMATLGTGLAFFGLASLITNESPIVLNSPTLQNMMSASTGLPVPVWIFLAVIALSTWFLHTTVGGRQLYATGANVDAARYAGVRVDLVGFLPFAITGLFSAVAGLILLGQLSTALPDAASSWPLQVIAAAVVGGVSIAGGRGTILMAVVGVLLIAVVNNGFNLLDLSSAYQSIFTGVIIVVAVTLDVMLSSRPSSPAYAGADAQPPDDERSSPPAGQSGGPDELGHGVPRAASGWGAPGVVG